MARYDRQADGSSSVMPTTMPGATDIPRAVARPLEQAGAISLLLRT
jgi:hypothetical protein